MKNDSLSSVKSLLCRVLTRLHWKDNQFSILNSATQEEIQACLNSIKQIDDTVTDIRTTKQSLPNYPRLREFIDHCCKKKHYSFEIRKCGGSDCNICKPLRLPKEVFQKLHPLPDPTPGCDGHYLPFTEVFGQQTSEEYRPSLHLKTAKKTLPFSASKQHVKNVDMMLLCEECKMWRLLYSRKKLKKDHHQQLEARLDGLMFTCGSSLQDLNLCEPLNEVYVRNLNCYDPVERNFISSVGMNPSVIIVLEKLKALKVRIHIHSACNADLSLLFLADSFLYPS